MDSDTFPLTHPTIDKYQPKDKAMLDKLKCANYRTKSSSWVGNILIIICKSDKIVVPKILPKYAVNWYHTYLLHTAT